ncbi:hypothetical protein RCZ04_01930 [Capnocytophaga sp. HP1101]
MVFAQDEEPNITATEITTAKRTSYSFEVGFDAGMPIYTDLKDLDKALQAAGNPVLSKNLDFSSNILFSSYITLRRNRWGLMFQTFAANLNTEANTDKHYYDGDISGSAWGVLFDAVKTNNFTLSPYVMLGYHKAEVYLDYKFEQGVVPTFLQINAKENHLNVGLKAYFRVGTWQEDRLQLFVNGDVAYLQAYGGTWRFDNRRIDAKDFGLSGFTISGGVTLRYTD